jgi:hemerythrin-like domain-containing protein
MKPRGLLMIEHRLIEKVLIVAKNKAMNENEYNPLLIETIVDFIKTYADRTHHGKEEDILFKKIEGKKINDQDERIMNELIDEHRQAREKVKEIVELNNQFIHGDRKIVPSINKILLWLSSFYPVHIKKEDDVFFPNTEKYFSKEEMDALLNDFYEFDRKMIHEKYQKIYENIKNS